MELNLAVKVHPAFMEHLPVKVFNFNSQGPSCIYSALPVKVFEFNSQGPSCIYGNFVSQFFE